MIVVVSNMERRERTRPIRPSHQTNGVYREEAEWTVFVIGWRMLGPCSDGGDWLWCFLISMLAKLATSTSSASWGWRFKKGTYLKASAHPSVRHCVSLREISGHLMGLASLSVHSSLFRVKRSKWVSSANMIAVWQGLQQPEAKVTGQSKSVAIIDFSQSLIVCVWERALWKRVNLSVHPSAYPRKISDRSRYRYHLSLFGVLLECHDDHAEKDSSHGILVFLPEVVTVRVCQTRKSVLPLESCHWLRSTDHCRIEHHNPWKIKMFR